MIRPQGVQANNLRNLSRYRFLWVSIMLSLLLASGLGYYQHLLAESQRLALQLQARNFIQAATVVRAFWQLRAKPADTLELNGFVYRVNNAGWPVDAYPIIAKSAQGGADKRCKRLILSLIIAPLSVTVNTAQVQAIDISTSVSNSCRFYGPGASKELYFEYDSDLGRVTPVVSS